jgi:DNA-binding GntR family transcriptional regulator
MAAATSAIRVRDELRAAILDGSLGPGERLRAEALAERFGTSRTPIREALVMLEREGLAELHPNRGAVVRAFDHSDLLDLYEVRALIEPHAAGLAATRIGTEPLDRLRELCRLAGRKRTTVADQVAFNEEFHRIIGVAAASNRLLEALRSVAGIPRAFRTAFWADPDQRAQSLFCHRELVAAFDGRRAEFAEAVMRMHILGARDFLLEVIDDRSS